MGVLAWAGTSEETWLPTEDDLPCDDGEPMETQLHVFQMLFLIESLSYYWRDRQDVFTTGNMFVYYRYDEDGRAHSLGPDFFAVLDVSRRPRKSWVVWMEGKGPDVVIELLSESTALRDRTEKKRIYQDQLRVPEYFWYDPFGEEWAGFTLQDGVYQPIVPQPGPRGTGERLKSKRLGLMLVRWEGSYLGVHGRWLRWATPEGEIVPIDAEVAVQEQQRADQARERAERAQEQVIQAQEQASQAQRHAEQERARTEQERVRAERLAEKLRALGVDPDT